MNFDMKQFYTIATILMIVGFAGSVWSAVHSWPILFIANKITTISGICFNLLLVVFFAWLWKTTPATPKIVNNPDLDKLLSDYKSEDVKGGNKNGKDYLT